MRRLYRKATTIDASFDPRSEPTNTRAAWDRVIENLESGMRLYILYRVPEPTGVAEARTQQTFVDILDRDVIEPLRKLKVSEA